MSVFVAGGGASVAMRAAVAAAAWYLPAGVSAANCKVAYQPKGAATLAASYVNLAHPGTNDAAPGVAPTFNAATGWEFNAGSYLTTGVTLTQSYTLAVQFSGYVGGMLAGAHQTGYYVIQPSDGSGVNYIYGANNHSRAPILTAGNLAIAGSQGYRNGSADGAALTGATFGTLACYLGAYNFGGSAGTPTTATMAAAAIYDVTLTGGQMAQLAASMAAL
jgi:hypothetical protein